MLNLAFVVWSGHNAIIVAATWLAPSVCCVLCRHYVIQSGNTSASHHCPHSQKRKPRRSCLTFCLSDLKHTPSSYHLLYCAGMYVLHKGGRWWCLFWSLWSPGVKWLSMFRLSACKELWRDTRSVPGLPLTAVLSINTVVLT